MTDSGNRLLLSLQQESDIVKANARCVMLSGPPIDRYAWSMLSELPASDLRAICEAFIDEAQQRLNEIDAALASRDESAFALAIHSLKSIALTVGASTLVQHVDAIEHQHNANDLSGLQEPLIRAKEVYLGVRTYLEQQMQQR